MEKRGVYSEIQMATTGFKYTGDGDTARCKDCGLENSNWTLDMDPFNIHKKQKPNCPYVQSIMLSLVSCTSTVVRNTSASNKHENRYERQEIETISSLFSPNILIDTFLVQEVRTRTFSHWSQNTTPSIAQMIEAGFFSCDIRDRVICIYCNLICQQWTYTDDPCEVHQTLSTNCPYVKANLIRRSASSISIIIRSSEKVTPSNEILLTAACHPFYAELPKRRASFDTWPHENLSLVDDLVRAGFFYTGRETTVTCFYCNGSLKNCGPNDNPMIRHARYFPHCAYAEEICGPEKFRKIQKFYRAQEEEAKSIETKHRARPGVVLNTNTTTDSQQESMSDEITLSRRVSDRLDLPIFQNLLDQGFKRPVIEKCWENQLRIKKEDFKSQFDLYLACLILQKQIEHIDNKKENITIPRIKMKEIREQNEVAMQELAATTTRSASNITDIDMTTSSQSSVELTTTAITPDQGQSAAAPSSFCVLCLTKEKGLACVPCGHLATCVSCGQSLRSCPICRREIKALFRIYL